MDYKQFSNLLNSLIEDNIVSISEVIKKKRGSYDQLYKIRKGDNVTVVTIEQTKKAVVSLLKEKRRKINKYLEEMNMTTRKSSFLEKELLEALGYDYEEGKYVSNIEHTPKGEYYPNMANIIVDFLNSYEVNTDEDFTELFQDWINQY